MGDQSAKVFVDGKKVFDVNDEFDYSVKPINEALKMLGVIKSDGKDEFDTIGLGRYRSNSDFNI